MVAASAVVGTPSPKAAHSRAQALEHARVHSPRWPIAADDTPARVGTRSSVPVRSRRERSPTRAPQPADCASIAPRPARREKPANRALMRPQGSETALVSKADDGGSDSRPSACEAEGAFQVEGIELRRGRRWSPSRGGRWSGARSPYASPRRPRTTDKTLHLPVVRLHLRPAAVRRTGPSTRSTITVNQDLPLCPVPARGATLQYLEPLEEETGRRRDRAQGASGPGAGVADSYSIALLQGVVHRVLGSRMGHVRLDWSLWIGRGWGGGYRCLGDA